MGPAFIRLALAALITVVSTGPLSHFVDHARVLVISAPSVIDPRLHRQDHILASFSAELNDRDLVVIHVVGDQAADTQADRLDANAVRRAVGLSSDRFGLVLVGKDGGVKMRRDAPVTVTELFRIIDAMPMRQEETRRTGH